jgi:sec-independent protein translocase protein TatB
MFDFAWSEIVVIAVVALLVIGPKDLPKVLRTVGIWVGKARGIAREFQSSLDQMIRESELEDVRKEVEKATSMDIAHEIEKTVDPGGEMKQALAEPVLSDHSLTTPESAPPPAPPVAPEPAAAQPPVTDGSGARPETAPLPVPPVLAEPPPLAVEPRPPEAAVAEPQPKSGTHA